MPKKPLPGLREMTLPDWLMAPARTAVFFWLNGWLMVLLALGTWDQVGHGLYHAKQTFFASWVWMAGGVLPLPGGQLTLLLVAWGLLVKLIRMRWRRAKVSSILVHGGVLLLLLGAWVTMVGSVEGTLILRQGQTAGRMVRMEGNTPRFIDLPFRLRLDRFTRETYPGTDTARAYSSAVTVTDKGTAWPAVIEMNAPLRLEGYTVYQASFDEDASGTTSVLQVVRNGGRIFPYVTSLMVALGLLLYLLKRCGVRALAAVALLLLPLAGQAQEARSGIAPEHLAAWRELPVLNEGRIKPLDTLARVMLTHLSGWDTVDGRSAAFWLAETLFDPASAYQRAVFRVEDPQVAAMLGLPPRGDHRYAFAALLPGLGSKERTIRTLDRLDHDKLTGTQRHMVELYDDAQGYFALSRSLSMLLPVFNVGDPALALKLGVELDRPMDYLDIRELSSKLSPLWRKAADLESSHPSGLDGTMRNVLALAQTMREVEQDNGSALLAIIPSPWHSTWTSPWQALETGEGSPLGALYLEQWGAMMRAWYTGDTAAWDAHVAAARNMALAWPGVDRDRLEAEAAYNRFKPLRLSLMLYVAAFALGVITLSRPREGLRRGGTGLLAAALAVHLAGLAARVYLLGRPPVGTLYESMVFVAAVAGLGGLAVEALRGRGLGLTIGAGAAMALQAMALGFTGGGDTLGVLVAVLNTNFWLATHVLAITSGYALCVLAALLAHGWLIAHALHVRAERREDLYTLAYRATLLALLMTALGTALGGIWADQSWGRFWGWDPKENGALLICLWLIWLLHGRMAGILNELWFMAGVALTTLVVGASWIGVNLMGVGLHSYGFTTGVAAGLALFCLLEALAVSALAVAHRLRLATTAPRARALKPKRKGKA
jgi:ABC-type transport system involved in cytochrome c biogenesis permease subunit